MRNIESYKFVNQVHQTMSFYSFKLFANIIYLVDIFMCMCVISIDLKKIVLSMIHAYCVWDLKVDKTCLQYRHKCSIRLSLAL
jgi:hypothetical protein